MNSEIDKIIAKSERWNEELQFLREILIECQLIEEVKWNSPVYTFNSSNVALLGSFKEYFVLSFVKGVLLNDAKKLLIPPGEKLTFCPRLQVFIDE